MEEKNEIPKDNSPEFIKEGIHRIKILDVESVESKNGTPGFEFRFCNEQNEIGSGRFWLTEKSEWRLHKFMRVLGFDTKKGPVKTEKIPGTECYAIMKKTEYELNGVLKHFTELDKFYSIDEGAPEEENTGDTNSTNDVFS